MAALTMPVPYLAPPAQGRWLEVVSHTDPKYGGLSAAVPMLGRYVASHGDFEVSLAAFTAAQEQLQPAGYAREQMSFWPVGRAPWLRERSLQRSFAECVRGADGVHIHGLWEQSTAVAAKTARMCKVPYILSAHGMLEPWALATKRLKKMVYARLIERGNVAGAACLHALTRAEADQFARFGARSPIAIIPNGVDIPHVKSPGLFLKQFPSLEGKRIVLFLARLHEKKGLDILLQAWAAIAGDFPDAQLVLAGPDSDGTEATLRQFVDQHHLGGSVLFTGMLNDRLKWSALAAVECFVLPSYSEGLSVSVLEAMGMGLPVIVTEACNMPEVAAYGAGWQIQPEAPAVAAALREMLGNAPSGNAPSGNAQMGARGRALIEARYTWKTVAAQMSDVYRWVQGGPLPNDVALVYPS